MLVIINNAAKLNFGQLEEVYKQSIEKAARMNYSNLDGNAQILESLQDFYDFISSYFQLPGTQFFIWAEQGVYVSALRMEPFMDGYLVEGLETAPEQRNKGYAEKLLHNALSYCKSQNRNIIYSHIDRQNLLSVRLHMRCGFKKILDYSRCLDGSVVHSMDTYCIKLQ